MKSRLFGGFDTLSFSYHVYELENGELVFANNFPAFESVLEALTIYLTNPGNPDVEFKFFSKREDGSSYCEGVIDNIDQGYEVFICGYGNSDQEAFEDCIKNIDRMKNLYCR